VLIDNFSPVTDAASGTKFITAFKILFECFPHSLKLRFEKT
jgi:hypothetical protein